MKIQPIQGLYYKTAKIGKVSSPLNPQQKNNITKTTIPFVATATMLACDSILRKNADKDMEAMFIKHGYTKNDKGNYEGKVSDEGHSALRKKYGNYGWDYASCKETPISASTLNYFSDFVNAGNKKNLKATDENFDNMLMIFSKMKDNKICDRYIKIANKNPEVCQIISNLAKRPPEKEEIIAIDYFKSTDSEKVNDALKNSLSAPREMKLIAKKIEEYIDTQKITEPFTVYRTEEPDILKNVKVNGSENLNFAEMLKDPKNVNEVKELLLNNEITATRSSFMSTSIKDDIFSKRGDILWKLKVLPNSKGAFIDGLNFNGKYSQEMELLLQKDSKIKITNAEFDKNSEKWILEGEVSN